MKKSLFSLLGGLIIGALGLALFVRYNISNISAPEFHEHADFALFINGEQFDFSKHDFMSNKPCKLTKSTDSTLLIDVARAHEGSPVGEDNVDLHDNDGQVVHVHEAGITWHNFFETLEMTFDDHIIIDDNDGRFEEYETNSFVYIVNGKIIDALANMEIRDLDQVLISYGTRDRSEDSIQAEFARVTNKACLQSGSCPHRGRAVIESCGASVEKSKLIQWLGL